LKISSGGWKVARSFTTISSDGDTIAWVDTPTAGEERVRICYCQV
jgi:hypothetical protein